MIKRADDRDSEQVTSSVIGLLAVGLGLIALLFGLPLCIALWRWALS